MEDAKENDVTDAQGERRRLLEEWRAKKIAKTPATHHAVHRPAERVPVFQSEKKKILASGAARVATVSRTSHVLDSPALRVKPEDVAVKEATPMMGRAKTVAKTDVKTEKKTVAFVSNNDVADVPEKKVLHFEEREEKKHEEPSTARRAAAPPLLQRSDSVSMRLTSALAAAFRATIANSNFARRIYIGILNDTERFHDVETSSQFWMSYALFEEHCGNFKDALQLYERGLELVPAEQAADLRTNLYIFMLRMDERIAHATSSDEAPQIDIAALQAFAVYVRSTQPAVIDELDSRKAEEPCCVSRLSLAALMLQVAGTSDTDKVLEADRLCVVMEATTPRRSARLADKMRQNYAHAVPWWLQNEAEWTN